MFSFGPVSSRRLGRSLGVNNIPPKICSYSCVYCQLGKTLRLSIERRAYYDPRDIFKDVVMRVESVVRKGGSIDYITIVPDGEPTLDANLGRLIRVLKELGIPVAVITNASLLWMDDVRKDLSEADLVSIKIDSVSKHIWRRVNRPHKLLRIDDVLEGIKDFSHEFNGLLISETMLINNIDYGDELRRIASYLGYLKNLRKAYIAVPTRPPAESWVRPAEERILVKAYDEFSKVLGEERVEYLIGLEDSNFTFINEDEEELIRVASVHPLREDIIEGFLKRFNRDWSFIENLVRRGILKVVSYEGRRYFVRSFTK